jgi:hypothetical protein
MPPPAPRNLPTELFALIISFCTPATLATLCRTSARLRDLAAARLYSSLTLRPNVSPEAGAATLTPFAYLCFTAPAYAALVTDVTVPEALGATKDDRVPRVLGRKGEEEKAWPVSGTEELERVLRRRCKEFAADEKEAEEMYAELEGGVNEDGVFALLLASLPNLRRLDVEVGKFIKHEAFHDLIERIAARVRSAHRTAQSDSALAAAFTTPLDVRVKADRSDTPNNPVQLVPFLHLPNLRSLYGMKMGVRDFPSDPFQSLSPFLRLAPGSIPLVYLELRFSRLNHETLSSLLAAATPGVFKTLNYEVGCPWAVSSISHAATMASLAPHHATLTSLAFSHEGFYPYQLGSTEPLETVDDAPFDFSFTCFAALRRLKVAPVFVWGLTGFQSQAELKRGANREMLWRALPASLEELWITRAVDKGPPLYEEAGTAYFAPDCLIPALELVVQHRAEAFPGLRRVRLQTSLGNWRDAWIDALVAFCQRAEEEGVECTIILEDLIASQDDDGRALQRGGGGDEDVEWQECGLNEKGPKLRILASEEDDLGATLRSLKADINQ